MESGYLGSHFLIDMLITSSQNSAIKHLRALYKDKQLRKSENIIIAEGVNLVKDIPDDFSVKELFLKESREESLRVYCDKFNIEPYIVKDGLFDAVSDTVTPSGIIALVERKNVKPNVEGETVILADGIKDPGNLGTIIRTSAARGVRTVLCASCADAFSPKAVRSAMGGTFRTDVIEVSENEAIELLDDYSIVGLDMSAKSIYGYKRSGKIAIAVGSEAHGLSMFVKSKCHELLSIPMENGIESLNAAISVAIAMYVI